VPVHLVKLALASASRRTHLALCRRDLPADSNAADAPINDELISKA
jgi:hypothetical protein